MHTMMMLIVNADWERASVQRINMATGDVSDEYFGTDIESAMAKLGFALDTERQDAEEG